MSLQLSIVLGYFLLVTPIGLITMRLNRSADEMCIRDSILINHSVAVQPGETVLICSNELAQPLVEAVYKKVLVKGAFPVLKITFSTLAPLYYQHASGKQLDTLLEIEELTFKQAQVMVDIDAPGNVKAVSYTHLDVYKRQRSGSQGSGCRHGADYSQAPFSQCAGGDPGAVNPDRPGSHFCGGFSCLLYTSRCV